jgi:hypothetical protein
LTFPSTGFPTIGLFGTRGPFSGGVSFQVKDLSSRIYTKFGSSILKAAMIISFAQKQLSEVEIRWEHLRGEFTESLPLGVGAVLNWGRNGLVTGMGFRQEYLKRGRWFSCEMKSNFTGCVEVGKHGLGSISFIWLGITDTFRSLLPKVGFALTWKE